MISHGGINYLDNMVAETIFPSWQSPMILVWMNGQFNVLIHTLHLQPVS